MRSSARTDKRALGPYGVVSRRLQLGIHPSLNALCEAARCHSVGCSASAVSVSLRRAGISNRLQLAGREQPRKMASSQVKGGEAPPGPPDLLSPEVLRSLPLQVARFFLHEPRNPPPWRRQETLAQRAHREMIKDCG